MDSSLIAGYYCRQLVTDVSLSSLGTALRSSAYSDAILHIRCHRHAGKLSSGRLVPLPLFCLSSLSTSPPAGLRSVFVLPESCHPEFPFGHFVLLSFTFLPPVAVASGCLLFLALFVSLCCAYKLFVSVVMRGRHFDSIFRGQPASNFDCPKEQSLPLVRADIISCVLLLLPSLRADVW